VEREAAVQEMHELDEERRELRLLLDAKNEEVSNACDEILVLRHQVGSVKSTRSFHSAPSALSPEFSPITRHSEGNLHHQMTEANLGSASSEASEEDGATTSGDGTGEEDNVPGAEQQTQLPHTAQPHPIRLQGACNGRRQSQQARSAHTPAAGRVTMPAALPGRYETLWEMVMASFSCCARHTPETQAASISCYARHTPEAQAASAHEAN